MRHKSKINRFLSFIFLMVFSLQSALGAAPALPVGTLRPEVEWDLPAELGSITDRFVPDTGKDGKWVVFLRDAHGVLEAQRNIAQILEWLAAENKIDFLALEGAAGELEPERFRIFDSAEKNEPFWERLFQESILSGAEMFLLKTEAPLLSAGAETEADYLENLNQFRRVHLSRRETGAWIRQMYGQLDRLTSHFDNQPLREVIREWKRFHDGEIGLADYVRGLSASGRTWMSDPERFWKHQAEWPHLSRLARLISLEPELETERIGAERDDFLRALESARLRPELRQQFAERSESGGAGGVSLRPLFEQLFEARPEIFGSLGKYRHYLQWAQYQILASEIRGPELFEEVHRMTKETLEGLVRSPEEKSAVETVEKLFLLEKLFRLELSHDQWRFIDGNREAYGPAALAGRFGGAGGSGVPVPVFEMACRFYETAVRRDRVLFQNLTRAMAVSGRSKAALVAGGFHGEGIKSLLRWRGIAYFEITPSFREEAEAVRGMKGPHTEESSRYVRRMLRGKDHVAIPVALQKKPVLRRLGELDYITRAVRKARGEAAREARAAALGQARPDVFDPAISSERVLAWLRSLRPGQVYRRNSRELFVTDPEKHVVLKIYRVLEAKAVNWLSLAVNLLSFAADGMSRFIRSRADAPAGEPLRGYRLAESLFPEHPLRFRILPPADLTAFPNLSGIWPSPSGAENAVVLQDFAPEHWFLREKIAVAVRAGDRAAAERLIREALGFLTSLWKKG
ncbi:MAG: hypothetical protein HY714_00680, partial [Candidatus Omnitrophica bacterium]|nr:hypothetical protein [Candidatus Omnitrophota bacterium]